MKKDTSPSLNLENGPRKSEFQKALLILDGLYPEEILGLVKNNAELLSKGHAAWKAALADMAVSLGIEATRADEIPDMIEQATFDEVKEKLSREKPRKIILGIAGPGAVGKETIKDGLSFDVVTNTTTRPKRDYEDQDKQYHFVDDEGFREMASRGNFVVSMDRSERGQYGIQKEDIEKVLFRSRIGVIEENPANLTKLNDYIKTYQDREFILIYILPPSPVFPHLAARLAGRCKKSGEDFKSTISSTLGSRQLDEFNSVTASVKKGMNVVFIVNDEVARVVKKIKDLVVAV